MAARDSDPGANRINLEWLLRFRSGELLAQAAAVLLARWVLKVALPLGPLLALIAVGALANLAAALWLRRTRVVPEPALGLLLALDVLLFSGLLSLTGGPYNSFSFLYVIQIALGALVLSPLASVGLALLSLGAFGALFSWHIWLPVAGQEIAPHELHHLQSHVQGMWVALLMGGGFIVYFVQRVRRSLAAREAELRAANDLVARSEKLASLATLAAGAAHELSTPLSTIALVARELERRLSGMVGSEGARDDVQLIRSEVDRCRSILTRMARDAGESTAEAPRPVSPRALLAAAVAHLPAAPEVVLSAPEAGELRVPVSALAQALHGLIRNAQQASPPNRAVAVRASLADGTWVLEVEDQGGGMSPEVAARAGEPFFTTKAPGEGMGLGLFLARATATQLGGGLEIAAGAAGGTRVRLWLPCDRMPQPVSGDAALAVG